MRPPAGWIHWPLLCLCAWVTASAPDHPEHGHMIPDQITEDQVQPETGTEPAAQIIRCNKPAWRMPGQYLVMLREGTHVSQVQRSVRRLRVRAARGGHLLQVLHTYTGALRGFLVQMSSDLLHLVVNLPHIDYIEEDSSIFAQSAPWNLQRLLQPRGATSESGTYTPPNSGGKAEVFLMDGSVQSSHREVDGRVHVADFNNVPEEDGVKVHRQASQCDSHGTHVAGVVTGSDSGVAPGADVKLVRVLNCQGKGTVSGALAGLEFVRASLVSRPAASAVVLLPFVGGLSRSLNAACRDLVSLGAVVIAAAGNYRDDACLYSPASEPEVITVGAVNSLDQLMSQGAGGTNFGRCVDLFAPGDDIVSASSDCSTCFTSHSGTSQAAAHAAGVAAVILTSNQKASPVQVLQVMLRHSISNTINFLSLSDQHRHVTPNLVTAMPPANNTDVELLCRSVWSERSGVTAVDRAVARCRHGEEMMSCRAFSPDGVDAAETISVSGGQVECVASHAAGASGVFAVARCCVTGGLQCQVQMSPEPGKDVTCDKPQQHLTGCSSTSHPHVSDRGGCVVKDAVTSQAVCCHAPSLECHLLERTSADQHQVEVSCSTGWTLTDCSAASKDPAILEPVARGNSCHVRSISGADGVAGLAVCCRVRPPEE